MYDIVITFQGQNYASISPRLCNVSPTCTNYIRADGSEYPINHMTHQSFPNGHTRWLPRFMILAARRFFVPLFPIVPFDWQLMRGWLTGFDKGCDWWSLAGEMKRPCVVASDMYRYGWPSTENGVWWSINQMSHIWVQRWLCSRETTLICQPTGTCLHAYSENASNHWTHRPSSAATRGQASIGLAALSV